MTNSSASLGGYNRVTQVSFHVPGPFSYGAGGLISPLKSSTGESSFSITLQRLTCFEVDLQTLDVLYSFF